MDKLKYIIKYNKKMMMVLSILVIIAIISGSLFTIILNNNDKEQVIKSVKLFCNTIMNNNYSYIDSLKNIVFGNLFLYIIVWVIGISVVGLFIIIGLIFWKAFTLGFTISSFILSFKLKGLILAMFYIFPSLIINLLILMYLSTYSIELSIILIKCIIKKKSLNFKAFMYNYTRILLISIFIFFISCLYEVFISPYVLKLICSFLFK